MSSVQRAMQAFRAELASRVPRMKRGAYLEDVRVGPVYQGQFTVTGTWKNKDGTTGQHVKIYGSSDVFKQMGPQGFKLVKRQCRHTDDFIREVLRIRGVIL